MEFYLIRLIFLDSTWILFKIEEFIRISFNLLEFYWILQISLNFIEFAIKFS